MLFTSYEFLAFLGLVLILYYVIPRKYQWILLLLASYIFYAFSGFRNFIFIIITTLSTWFLAGKISDLEISRKAYIRENKETLSSEEKKSYKAKVKKKQKGLLICALLINFGMLAVLKILGLSGIILPLGISFYTFTAMGYLIDVYRGKYEAQKNVFKFGLFVSFFPVLIQGPINRYDDLSKSLYEEHKADYKTICFGLERILWGFFKKLVIADRVLPLVKELISAPDNYGGVYVFIAMVLYALQLYADFTGGIDITIGIGEAMGITMKENFIRPFFSKGLAEYWRRWHISLGKWFTDYIFYPVSVSDMMLKLSRFARKVFGDYIGKRMPVYVSSLAVWFVTGIWHGLGWNYVVWGLLNGLIIIISQELEPLYKKFHAAVKTGRGWDGFCAIRTVFITSALRMLDLYKNVPLTFKMLGNMIVKPEFSNLNIETLSEIGFTLHDTILVTLAAITLFVVSLIQRSGCVREKIYRKPIACRYALFAVLFIIVIVFGAYGIGYDASQFIYNQF